VNEVVLTAILHHFPLSQHPSTNQGWPESHRQTPTRSCSQIFGSGSKKFFKFENPTPLETPATIDITEISVMVYVGIYMYKRHADSCY